jgi:hypothetical protein
MGSVSGREGGDADFGRLASSTDNKVTRLKHELVLQMYFKRGDFWEAVSEARDSWGVTPRHDLPQYPLYHPLMPPGMPDEPPNGRKGRNKWLDTNDHWLEVLRDIAENAVPSRYLLRRSRLGWSAFISACVACDPSVPGLLDFAKLGVIEEGSLPIDMGDPTEAARAEFEYWWTTLQKVSELYLEPQGLTLDGVLEEVGRKYPEIEAKRGERLWRSGQRRSIVVDEYTPKNEAEKAFDLIAEEHESRPEGGHPGQGQLLAVECAVLYDHQNALDPRDKRRRKWTHKTLYQAYDELGSPRVAKAYVKLGREIAAKRQGAV